MIRIMLAIGAGYIVMAALNSFVHLIISVYNKSDLMLAGVANLPSFTWSIGITLFQFLLGLLGGLLTSTLAQNKSQAILGFILLMVAMSLADYTILSDREPVWYLIAAPILKISGIYIGFRLFQLQQTQPMKSPKS